MAGSWEIKQASSVLCGILHTDVTTLAWALGWGNLLFPGGNRNVLPISGQPYDMARNSIAAACVNGPFEWLFFLDSDVIPPRDAILRLIAHQKPIISGLYNRRSPPWSVPVMIRGGQWVTQFVSGEVVEVDLVGAGCLLIHRSVLERLPAQRPGKPWFDWRVDLRSVVNPDGSPYYPPGECLSEDFTFCHAAKHHLGIPTLVDTGIRCRHVGYAEAEYGSFKPLEVLANT